MAHNAKANSGSPRRGTRCRGILTVQHGFPRPQSFRDVAATLGNTGSRRYYTSDSNDPQSKKVLLHFLSEENMASPNPTIHTPHEVQSMYTTFKESKLKLLPKHFSNLIYIFTSLSLLASTKDFKSSYSFDRQHKFSHIAQLMSAKAAKTKIQQTHWSMVFQFLEDKKTQGYVLDDSDLYWVMRCCLQRAHEARREQAGGECAKLTDAYRWLILCRL